MVRKTNDLQRLIERLHLRARELRARASSIREDTEQLPGMTQGLFMVDRISRALVDFITGEAEKADKLGNALAQAAVAAEPLRDILSRVYAFFVEGSDDWALAQRLLHQNR